jgi:hypothetical protein
VSCVGKWYFYITRRFDAANALPPNALLGLFEPGSVRKIAIFLTEELSRKN